jgi:MYXO-CTERM domain-containing protein
MSRAPSPTVRCPTRLIALGALLLAWPASAYQLLGNTWDMDRGPSEYAIEPSGSDDITDGSDIEAVRQAFRNWSCIEGSTFRFRERTDVEGVRVDDQADGINSVFWDETGEFGLGPSTLGVAMPAQLPGQQRFTAADIIFNGADHTWSTDDNPGPETVDVGSIAIHEVGHWLGLGHACTDMTESDCLSIDEAVMTPVYSAGTYREPFEDDINGLLAMYEQPADDASTCDGPFRIGEYCSCNDDCAGDLLCIAQDDGRQICSRTCDGDNPDCGPGFNCILGEAPDDGPAPGKCVAGIGGEPAQAGAVCQPNGMCGQSDCTQLAAAGGQRVCFRGCQEDANCPDGYVCAGIACLLDTSTVGVQCPDTGGDGDGDGDEMMPGCTATDVGDATPVAGALALLGVMVLVRRRRC